MKLDKDLMRDILLAIEANPELSASYNPLDLPEYDAEVISLPHHAARRWGFI